MNSPMSLTVFSLLLATALAVKIPVKDCGSKLAKINSIDISPCSSIPCPFKKGTTVDLTVDFTSNADIQNAQTSVHGYIAGLPIPFPMKDSDACHFMDCPIKADEQKTYKNSLEVLSSYPSIQVMVKWEVKSNDDVFCFTVPVKITS